MKLLADDLGRGSGGTVSRLSAAPTGQVLREAVVLRSTPALRTRRRIMAPPKVSRLFAPGWPLAWMFAPFPLWWAMGLTEWAPLALCLPMAYHLLRMRRVEIPRGFGWWALYLVWSLVGVGLLSVPAYGAVADSGSTRILTFSYRLIWYLGVTLVGLYVLNTRKELSTTRVTRIMALMFIWVVGGGILGILAPTFQFSSLMELVLPSGVSSVPFINHMIHPSAAQLQDVLGYSSPRPSAPYSYTNTWGVNLAVLAPFFVYAWLGKDAAWRRYAAPVVGLLAFVAVVVSLNRGLWVALAVAVLFVAIRSALQGKPGILAVLLLAGVVATAAVAYSPLGAVVQARLSSEGSINGRTNLGTLSVESVVKTSPLIGLGSTRNVQGNFNSIAGGATAGCPRCSPPALGTQGQLWLVVFCQGLVGLVLYLGFFAQTFLRHLRARSGLILMGLCVLVLSTVTMPVYNSLGTALMVVFVAVGLMAREQSGREPGAPVPLVATLGGQLASVRAHLPVIALLTIAGLAGGALWQVHYGVPTRAVMSFIVPPDRTHYTTDTSGLLSIDTEAQYLNDPAVTAAVARATKKPGPHETRTLRVLATPNSRVLHISYVADHASDAVAGARAATTAFIAVRSAQISQHLATEVGILAAKHAALAASLPTLSNELTALVAKEGKNPTHSATKVLRERIDKLQVQLVSNERGAVNLRAATPVAGTVLRLEPTKALSTVWNVSLGSGAMIGLVLGLLFATWSDRRGGRLGPRGDGATDLGYPVLARPERSRWWRRLARRRTLSGGTRAVRDAVRPFGVTAVADITGRSARPQISDLPGEASAAESPVYALVCRPHTAVRDLERAAATLTAMGGGVRGIVIV
ncbi:hypothetical protein [Lapillicoccus sp.]|uniref:O-antigen ligase family protein n=1 Tax=Lapillicoccus sp. TaxID=1909287 RepID=UPI0025D1FBB1|nr:hypothetical protein [Lapillicoccus sp.]